VPSRHVALPRRRVASLCLCSVLALALAGGTPPVAMSAVSEEGGALSELTKPETTPTQTTASTAATESTSSSNSRTVIVLALAAAVGLLIAIAFVIVRDARRVAPVADAQVTEGSSARDSAARLRRRRARAKAARQQRKRNR
jgi:ABC-type nitrate/sulfonate/bicarbonate transport system permease component